MQLVPITTNVVSSNPIHDEVYSIQHYVLKFVSQLRQVGGFLRVLQFPSLNKTDRHATADILLKVALNTITINSNPDLGSPVYSLLVFLIPLTFKSFGSNLSTTLSAHLECYSTRVVRTKLNI